MAFNKYLFADYNYKSKRNIKRWETNKVKEPEQEPRMFQTSKTPTGQPGTIRATSPTIWSKMQVVEGRMLGLPETMGPVEQAGSKLSNPPRPRERRKCTPSRTRVISRRRPLNL